MAASLGEIMNSLVLAAAVFIIDGEVNVTDFKKSKSVQRAAAQFLQDAPPQFKSFIEEIGFRPMRDLDHVKFRMTQPINPDKPGEPLVTLKGRFKPKRIHSSWAKNKDKTAIKQIKIAGKTAYAGNPNTPMFAMESARVIQAGYRPMVEQALKGTLPALRALPPFLRDAKAWLRFRSTSQARKLILKQQEASPLAEIHEIQVKGWLKADKLHAKMRIRARSPEAASGIQMMVSLGLLNSNHPSSMKLGRAMKFRVQGSTLSIDFKMKLNELTALRPPPAPAPGRGGPKVITVEPKNDKRKLQKRPSAPPPNQFGPQGGGFRPPTRQP